MRHNVRTVVLVVAVALATGLAYAASFVVPKNVSQTEGESAFPSVALDGTTARYVVWADNTNDTGGIDVNFRLRYSRFDENGDPAGPFGPGQVIPGTFTLDESMSPRAVVDPSGKIHVVFLNRVLERYDVFYTSFDPNAVVPAWSAPLNVSDTSGDSVMPALAVDSTGQLHLVWADDSEVSGTAEIFYKRRNLLGAWSTTPVKVSSSGGASSMPDVAVSVDDVPNVVWLDTTSGLHSVFFARQGAGGTFSTPKNVSKELFTGPIADLAPSIAIGPTGNLHIVWAAVDNAGGFDVYYRSAPLATLAFTKIRNLSLNQGVSKTPRVAVDSADQAHVVWADNQIEPGFDIFYSVVVPGGSFTSPDVIDDTEGRSIFPDIAIDVFDEIRVCWMDDDVNLPGTNFEIYCTTAGESIPPTTTPSTNPAPNANCGGFITSEPVTVTLTSTDNSGHVKKISYSEDKHNPNSQTVTFNACLPNPPLAQYQTSFQHPGQGKHTITFFAEDCDGNVELEKTAVFKVDSNGPFTSASITGSCAGPTCPIYTGPVEVVLVANDVGVAGVKETKFTIDNQGPFVYTGPIQVASDGVHTIQFFSEDKACNVEAPVKSITFEIRSSIRVQITRPRAGATYLNNQELLPPPSNNDPLRAQLGDLNLVVPAATFTATSSGTRISVQATVATDSPTQLIKFAQFCVHRQPYQACSPSEINYTKDGYDGIPRTSSGTYSFRYKVPFPVEPGLYFFRVEAADDQGEGVPVRKGSAEVAVYLTP